MENLLNKQEQKLLNYILSVYKPRKKHKENTTLTNLMIKLIKL